MTTRLSQFNNTGLPLNTGATFTGLFERTLVGLEICTFVNCSGLSLVTIEQSVDASNVRVTTTFNYNPENDVSTFSVPVALPFFRVKLLNGDIAAQAYLSLNTYVINTPPQQVVIAGGTADVVVGGVVDVSGSVVASNLITETLATRRVDFLVVGDWYRVASVGLTSGAQWNAIGAIVDGESVPAIGRLFKCLSIGPAVAGGGECYDVEYTTDVSATITNFPSFPATQPVSIAQDLSCNILNFPVTQAVSGTFFQATQPVSVAQDLSCNILNFPATQPVSGTLSLTDPTTVRIRDAYGDAITTTAGNLMVGINNIYTANPLHTIIDSGTLGLSTSANTIKIDQTNANNGVKVNPTALLPSRKTGLNDTAKSVSGKVFYGASYQNKSATVNCWIKLYDSVTAPTASDTPFLIQYLEAVQLYTLSHSNEDCFNAPITSTLWVRATLLPGDADNTDTGVDVEGTFFMGN